MIAKNIHTTIFHSFILWLIRLQGNLLLYLHLNWAPAQAFLVLHLSWLNKTKPVLFCCLGCECNTLFRSVGAVGVFMLQWWAACGGETDGCQGVRQLYRKCDEQPSPALKWVCPLPKKGKKRTLDIHTGVKTFIYYIFYLFIFVWQVCPLHCVCGGVCLCCCKMKTKMSEGQHPTSSLSQHLSSVQVDSLFLFSTMKWVHRQIEMYLM